MPNESFDIGRTGSPRIPNAEDALLEQFNRENLSEVIKSCLEIVTSDPFDQNYLDQKIRVWNQMEESKRGFKGTSSVKYNQRTQNGTLKILHFPETDAVKIEWVG